MARPAGNVASPARIAALLNLDPPSEIALQAAAELAGLAHAELLGLFLEDTDLLHLAGLPFAQELCMTSAVARGLDPQRMEQALRAAAGRARSRFDALAAPLRARQFETRRGDFVGTLLDAAREADMVVAAPQGIGLRARGGKLIVITHAGSTPNPLLHALPGIARRGRFVAHLLLIGTGDADIAVPETIELYRVATPSDAQAILRALAKEAGQ